MQANQHKHTTYLFIGSCWIYFSLGMMVLTTSAIMRTLIEVHHWMAWQGGLLTTLQAVGNLSASMLGGFCLQALGRRRTLCVGILCGIIGFGGITLVPNPALMYPLLFLTGIFWGISNTVLNILIAEAYAGNTARINLLHTTYAVGAVLAPLFTSALIGTAAGWRGPVWVVTAALGLALLAAWRMPIRSSAQAQDAAATGQHPVLFWRNPRFYLAALTLFTYVGAETAISTWISTFLYSQNPDFQNVQPETMISLMWLLLIVGRLIVSSLSSRLHKAKLLLVEAIGFLIGLLGLILFAANTPLVLLSVAFIGLSMSAMYGTTVANNSDLMLQSPMAPGLIFAGGGLGAAVVPQVTSLLSDRGGIRLGMWWLVLVVAVLVGLTAANLALRRKQDSPTVTP